MSAYFGLVYVSIVRMLLDVLELHVFALTIRVFPIMVSFKPGGGRKIQMYSDRFKGLVEYACVFAGVC